MFLVAGYVVDEKKYPCLKKADKESGKLNGGGRLVAAALLGDVLIPLTALVLGILGVAGVLRGLPPAASYSLLGLTGASILFWAIIAKFADCRLLCVSVKEHLAIQSKKLPPLRPPLDGQSLPYKPPSPESI